MEDAEYVDEIPKVSHRKAKSSAVWNYFSDNGKSVATCNWCSKSLSYKGGSTFNLRRHLGLHRSTVSFWPGRSKMTKFVKTNTPGKETAQEIPRNTISPEVMVMERNGEGKSGEVSGTRAQTETGKPHESDEGRVNDSVSESVEDVHKCCGGGSLNSMESELLKMAHKEHKTKMEILSLKKRYLELKISRLERSKCVD